MSVDPRQIYEDELAKWRAEKGEKGEKPRTQFEPMELDSLMNGETEEISWLIEDVWPMGRQIHIHAQRKSGKSLLMLWVACCLAIGRDPFTAEPRIPQVVGYWDPEMAREDIRERLEDMGFRPIPPLLIQNLHYYLLQPIPPLDTEAGGQALLRQAQAMNETAVILDTLSRFIAGDENASETYINFYRYTGQPLKAANISLTRTDHEGWEAGRSRGSSAKADDVDIVWQLKPTDDGIELTRKFTRVSYVPEFVALVKREEPNLHFTRAVMAWPAGTKEKALELDELLVPVEVGRNLAIKALKAAGRTVGKTNVLTAAIKWRKLRALP